MCLAGLAPCFHRSNSTAAPSCRRSRFHAGVGEPALQRRHVLIGDKRVTASLISLDPALRRGRAVRQAGTIVSALPVVIADCRYVSKRLASQSVRAQIEPFSGLKASCPSFEPTSLQPAHHGVGFGASFGRPKVSESAS